MRREQTDHSDGEPPLAFLRRLFDRAVAVADPMQIVARHLPPRPPGRVLVVGAGKASARMAEAVEAAWGPSEGLVITRYGHGRPCQGIEIVEAAHPVPDAAGCTATARMLNLVDGCGAADFVLALISGGASSLLVQPAGAMTLEEKRSVNAALLASGAPIQAMNVVRKHLSLVKGGQLAAAAYPSTLLTLAISDVPGDDPALIGSGPTVGDATTADDALGIVRRWSIALPRSALAVLQGGGGVVRPDDPRLSRAETVVIAAPAQSLAAAADSARAAGASVEILGDAIEGEARDVAAMQATSAIATRDRLKAGDPPHVILSGGEVTVRRKGQGIGGPNAEYCLALAIALDGAPGIHAIACDTDGVDGAADVAGAVLGPETLAKAKGLGLDPAAALAENDAHSFFRALGAQVVTGPTLTNVNDFRAILVQPPCR